MSSSMNDIYRVQRLREVIATLRPYLQKNSITEQQAEFFKNNLHKILLAIGPIMWANFREIYRVTINKNLPNNKNERVHTINFLKYPPPEAVKRHGRANYIGQSVLYATFNHLTAFNEMRPTVGDLVTISTWEMPKEERILIAPVFMITSGNDGESHNGFSWDFYVEYINMISKEPKHVQEYMDELLNFMSECFAKEVDYGNSCDYMLSAWLTNQLFSLERGNVEAIVYPSVRERLGFSNIVFKPEAFDKKYKLKKVQENIITMAPGVNGPGYFMNGTGEAIKFEGDKIVWKDFPRPELF